MAMTSMALARAALYAALDVPAVNALDGVAKVFDYEPAGQEMGRDVIVTIFATGVTPDEWQFSVRIYAHPDMGQEAAQRALDIVILGVEDALTTAGVGNIGPSQWTIGFTDNIGALVAQSDVIIGREDIST